MIGLGRPLRSRLHTSGTCRYPSLRYNQDAVYVHVPIFYARLTTPSGTAQLTRLQQVPIVTCCAPKRHRCLIPSLPSNQPIQFSLTLNIINTSSHHHITPLPRIHTCSMYTKGSSQNPDPTDRPMHLTCSIEKYTHHPYSTSLHPSTHCASIYHPSVHSTQAPMQAVRTSPASLQTTTTARILPGYPFLPSLLLPPSKRPELGWLTRLASLRCII